MKFPYPVFLIPVLLTLGCSPSAEEEQQAEPPASTASSAPPKEAANLMLPESTPEAPKSLLPPERSANKEENSASDKFSGDMTAAEREEASPTENGSTSPLAAPADPSVALPHLAPRPLPPVFNHLHKVLMEQSEPGNLLGVAEGTEMTDDERREFEEAREHVHEAVEAMQELFLAQMALVRVPLEHPDYCSMEPDETEDCIADCEAYLAESFRRDVEGFSYDESFLDKGCVEPGTRPGNLALLHLTELDHLIRAGEDILSPNEQWLQHLEGFMERHLASYDSRGGCKGSNGNDPFTRMRANENPVNWPNGTAPDAAPDRIFYHAAMRELIRREHRAWQRYFEAMSELVCPCRGYRGSGAADFRVSCESHLIASRERFVYMLMAGADNTVILSERACERAAELQELHGQHSFGEIFTETAVLFRHPKLAGTPWCIRFSSVGAGFIFLKDNKVLQQYLASHPEGGETEVRGYQMIESIGEPYETAGQEDMYASDIPAPKTYGALELRQVFHLLECPASSDEEKY